MAAVTAGGVSGVRGLGVVACGVVTGGSSSSSPSVKLVNGVSTARVSSTCCLSCCSCKRD